MVRALLASRTIIGLPSTSLVPCISNESREGRKQVDSIGVAILESNNGFVTWIRHAMCDKGWEGAATRGEKRRWRQTEQHSIIPGDPNRAQHCSTDTALAREWRGLEHHWGDPRVGPRLLFLESSVQSRKRQFPSTLQ
jgi:hypothetical protein